MALMGARAARLRTASEKRRDMPAAVAKVRASIDEDDKTIAKKLEKQAKVTKASEGLKELAEKAEEGALLPIAVVKCFAVFSEENGATGVYSTLAEAERWVRGDDASARAELRGE